LTPVLLRIALIGQSGSGKTQTASLLRDEFDCKIVKTGQICRKISQILFGNEDKSSTQKLDDALTPLDPSIFLRACLRELPPDGNIVVDSLRFSTDATLVTSIGFKTLRVRAPLDTRIVRLHERGQIFDPVLNAAHRSETELEAYPANIEIDNVGSLDELHAKIRHAVASLT